MKFRVLALLVLNLTVLGCVAAVPLVRPSTAPRGVAEQRKQALIASLQDAVAVSRAAEATNVIGEISSVISNNGGGLIGRRKYRVAQVPLAGEPFVVETKDLAYYTHFRTDTEGEFKIFARPGYDNEATRESSLLDHFKWDDLKTELGGKDDPLLVNTTFSLQKVEARRLHFLDKTVVHMLNRVVDPATQTIKPAGYRIEFQMDVPLADGDNDRGIFEAVANEKDIVMLKRSDEGDYAIPARVSLTGENRRGSYTGSMDNSTATLNCHLVHVTTGGQVTKIDFASSNGVFHREVESAGAHLRVAFDLNADRKGEGKILSVSGDETEQVGGVSWDADGLATLTFDDETRRKARLF